MGKQNNKGYVAGKVQEKEGRIINCSLKRQHIMPIYTGSKPVKLEKGREKKEGNIR
jgi:DNA polymerase II small subunit/DNA polymerase delta subunit B